MNAVSSHAAAAQGCSTQLAQDFLAGWSHNTPKLLSIFADDLVYEDTTVHAVLHGKEELRGFAPGWFKAFPDLSFTYKNAVVSGDRAAVEREVTGTQKGDMPGMPGSSPCWTTQTVRSSTSHDMALRWPGHGRQRIQAQGSDIFRFSARCTSCRRRAA